MSSLCLRSGGGLSHEKYQNKKYSLTVNRSHCGRNDLIKLQGSGKLGFFLHREFRDGLHAQKLCRFSLTVKLLLTISAVLY